MKLGRNRDSPSSSRGSLINRVFPVSWFSKFKQKSGSPNMNSVNKQQQRRKLDFPTGRETRFYSVDDDDDDAYWRLSFRKERGESRRRRGRINPLPYDSYDEFQVPVLSFKSFGSRKMEFIQKMKPNQHRESIQHQGAQLTTPRKDVNDRRSRKLRRRNVRKKKAQLQTGEDDGEGKSSKPVERYIFPIQPENINQMKEGLRGSVVSNSKNEKIVSSGNFDLSLDDEDYVFAALERERVPLSICQTLENKKFKEMKAKIESQERSAYLRRRSHNRRTKMRAHVPKTDCKVQVLEDMKRARIKSKKKGTKQHATEGSTIFNSFAVVKSSFNPQQDFRDSMVEMIRKKGLRRPEELEELLACYLTLNCDGYHDLIINVFQQVWFEMSKVVY